MKNMLPKFCVSLIVCVVLIGFQIFCYAQNQQPGDHSTMKTLGQWTTYAPMPSPKINHASVLYNGVVFVFGGSTTGGVASNDTYLYNIASDTWITGIVIPETRNFGTAEVVNGKIYLIGGYSQLAAPFTLNTSVLELDPATSNISIKSNMPTAVAGCASFVFGNKIYILGGSGSGGWNIDFKDLMQIYDPATDLWSTGTQLPYAARNIAAAANGSTIIIAGGYGKTPTF